MFPKCAVKHKYNLKFIYKYRISDWLQSSDGVLMKPDDNTYLNPYDKHTLMIEKRWSLHLTIGVITHAKSPFKAVPKTIMQYKSFNPEYAVNQLWCEVICISLIHIEKN